MFSTFFLNDTGNMGRIMDLGATDYVHSNKGILKTISTNHGILFLYIGNGSKMPISITPPLPLQTCFALFILIIFQHLGHTGYQVLKSLISNNIILCNKDNSSALCEPCQLGKIVRLPFYNLILLCMICLTFFIRIFGVLQFLAIVVFIIILFS